jgi:hypothetical protein
MRSWKNENRISRSFLKDPEFFTTKTRRTRREEKKENDTNGKYPYEAWYDV